MSKINWRNLFTSTILKRGQSYFEDGLVENLYDNDGEITAEVWGNEQYDVEILLNGSEVVDMSCTCPYAEDGTPCKHMAAVLLAWEESGGLKTTRKAEPPIPLEEAIQRLSTETMQKLLLQQAENDRSLQDTIRLYATGTVDQKQKNAWRRDLKSLIRKYAEVIDGYGDFDDCFQFFSDIEEYLHEHIRVLIDLHLLPEAVELLQEVYECILDMEYRYEACDVPDVNFCCLDYMDQIVNSADESYKEELYTFCLKKCEGYLSPCTDNLWQKTLFDSFTDEKYMKRTLIHIEKCLRQIPSEMYPFETVELIRAKVQFMRALGQNEKDIEAFRKQYRRYPAIREDEIREALDQGRIAEATEMLLDFRQTVPPHSPTFCQISERLILLYEEMNDCASYKKELKDYIFGIRQDNAIYVHKLKQALMADEWRAILPSLLQAKTMEYRRHELMAEEGMYRELLNELETEPGLFGLKKYEKILKPHFPEEIRDVFFAYLDQEMYRAGHRSAYESLAKRLKHMKTYPNGKEMAEQMANEWKRLYKRRSAMIEELKKAGF